MMQDSNQPDALKDGRRIYLGNLPYRFKPYEIEETLPRSPITALALSIRFTSPSTPSAPAIRATASSTSATDLLPNEPFAELKATICGRPCKVDPCDPKKTNKRRRAENEPGSFQRWGDWKTPRGDGGVAVGRSDTAAPEQGPYVALDHFTNLLDDHNGRRLYVGGLGKMVDQAQNQDEIRDIFTVFKPKLIGKRITNKRFRGQPGNHNFCFVDFETAEEANAAKDALHGKRYRYGRLKVSIAKTTAAKLGDVRPDDRYFPRDGGRDSGQQTVRTEGRDLSRD